METPAGIVIPADRLYVPGKTCMCCPLETSDIAAWMVKNAEPPTVAVESFP